VSEFDYENWLSSVRVRLAHDQFVALPPAWCDLCNTPGAAWHPEEAVWLCPNSAACLVRYFDALNGGAADE
jgi:hypothetical protein